MIVFYITGLISYLLTMSKYWMMGHMAQCWLLTDQSDCCINTRHVTTNIKSILAIIAVT